jgi:Fe-S cluster assembly protein SufD
MKTLREITKEEIRQEGAEWLRDLRRKAYERFAGMGFPTNRLESWKYINLEPILGSAFLAEEGLSSLFSFSGGGQGVQLCELQTALREKEALLKNTLGVSAAAEENPFALINTFSFRDGIFVYIPDHATLEAPVHLFFKAEGSGAEAPVFYPRILVIAGKCARVKLVVDFAGRGNGKFFSSAVAEVHLGEGACVDFFQIQRSESSAAIGFSTNRFYLKEYASLNAFSFSQGGGVTRNETSVEFQGQGGFASLKGLGVLRGESQIFSHAASRHHSPHCTSRQFYKMILSGRAKSEFNSLVVVPKGSPKSDSNQMSRNLLLSDTAEAFARPQLRIDTDDVQCIHGATVGQLETDELFYMRSRGLSKETARFVMTYAFAQEMLNELSGPALKAELEKLASDEIKECLKQSLST